MLRFPRPSDATFVFAGLHLLLLAAIGNPWVLSAAVSADGELNAKRTAVSLVASALCLVGGIACVAAARRLAPRRRAIVGGACGFVVVLYLLLFLAADFVAGRVAPVQVGGRLDVPSAEIYGWAFAPYQQTVIQNPDTGETYAERVNSSGWRDIEHPPVPTKPRVLLIGDSQVFGWGVRGDEIIARQIEKAGGNACEVVSMGLSGYSTDQQYLLLKEEGLRMRPDHVVLLFTPGNDIVGNLFDTSVLFSTPKPRFEVRDGELVQMPFAGRRAGPLRILLGHSNIVRLLRLRSARGSVPPVDFALSARGTEDDPFPEEQHHLAEDIEGDRSALSVYRPKQDWSDDLNGAWDTTCALIREMNRLSIESGATFTLYANSLPPENFAEEMTIDGRTYRFDLDHPLRLLREFARSEGIDWLEDSPEMRANVALLRFRNDAHYNPDGNRAAGEHIAAHLKPMLGK